MSPLTNTTAEDIVLNFDSWLGNQTPEARQGIDAHLKASGPYAEREKKRMAAMFAVSEDTGLDLDTISERWDVVRGGYAEQMAEDAYGRQGDESGGEWMAVRDDEDAFHAKLVQHATKRRDFRIQDEAFASAGAAAGAKLEPGDSMAESAKMLETAKSIEGFSIQDADKFANSYRQARDFMETKVGPYRGAARQIRQLLEEDAG